MAIIFLAEYFYLSWNDTLPIMHEETHTNHSYPDMAEWNKELQPSKGEKNLKSDPCQRRHQKNPANLYKITSVLPLFIELTYLIWRMYNTTRIITFNKHLLKLNLKLIIITLMKYWKLVVISHIAGGTRKQRSFLLCPCNLAHTAVRPEDSFKHLNLHPGE